MRIVVQRVKQASCQVEAKLTGSIDQGLMILVGFGSEDQDINLDKMADKLINLRIFEDEAGKMNLSLLDIKGKILSISQFTLYADCRKGRRPCFTDALNPQAANEYYQRFNAILRAKGIEVACGIFGADMQISLINDGPVTIILDSEEIL